MNVLYGRYRRLVLSISWRILRDHCEAEDVVQDIFLEIYKRAQLFDATRGPVKTWILQYAYTRSLDRRKYLAIRNGNGHSPNGNGSHNHREFQCDPSPNAFEWSVIQQRARIVNKAVERLSPKQKQILRLAYFEGLLMKEIAQQTGETLVNVRNHYYRGLQKLRDILREMSTGRRI